ncbi:exonuclease V isoform X3 [Ahaetulla prasina]|uniref:exonuclease V isoform X3 n=1 Tax=Ahaetulla prasina TaxID=499056 RepID=UPI002649E451|nr:exonuclease V isoform X3 [Ahaetulla prasina]
MSGRDSGLQNPEAASGFSDLSDSEFLQIEEPKIGELLSGPRPQPVDSRRANVEERKRRRAKRKRPRRTPLEAFHLRYLCVTDLSAQVWCEQQTVYHKEKPSVQLPEKTTVVLNTGKSIHLARELQDHNLVPVKTRSREDRWAIKLLNVLLTITNLRKGQRVRECPVFGVLEGIFVFGIIDQLNYTAKGELQLNELKTREKAYMPVPGQKKRDRFQDGLHLAQAPKTAASPPAQSPPRSASDAVSLSEPSKGSEAGPGAPSTSSSSDSAANYDSSQQATTLHRFFFYGPLCTLLAHSICRAMILTVYESS